MLRIPQINNQKGWVLIDSLIAVVIVSVALVSIVTMYVQATKTTNTNKIYNNAVYIAQKNLEDLKQYDGTATIKALPSAVTQPPITAVDNVTYTVQINPVTTSDTLDSHMYPYQATVSWTDNSVNPAATRSIQIAAYYYSN